MLVAGTAGTSSTPSRTSRPALVTAATSPRAVARTADTSTSCLARAPSAGSGSSVRVRASSPVDESSTQHGSSVTSSGTAVVLGCPADSSSTVRRGVPNCLATSASSSDTVFRSRVSESMISVSAAMVARSVSCSASSSIRENFVSRRSGISRM